LYHKLLPQQQHPPLSQSQFQSKKKRGFEPDTPLDKEPDSDDTSSERGDKRGGPAKKSRSSIDDSPPELVPQITIPPIKKRLPAKDLNPVSTIETLDKKT